MLKQIQELVKDKKVLLLGMGREGMSTFHFLQKAGGYKSLTIADQKEVTGISKKIEQITGEHYQDTLDAYDVVFKSPGVVLKKELSEYKCLITSQTEQFLNAYRMQTIGITGTKGKSTTTSLIYHVLKNTGKDAILMGNIGIPCFECAEKMQKDSIAVFEMSSHQLEFTHVSPHVGVLLNVHEEHLDHYGSYEKYKDAKCNVFRYQNAEDILFINYENAIEAKEADSQIRTVAFCGESLSHEKKNERAVNKVPAQIQVDAERGCILQNGQCYEIPVKQIHLLGHHNYFNIAIAYEICKLYEVTDQEFTEALKTFEPLPHRLKLIGEKEGIRFYDDSISTICETTIQALESIPDVNTLLIGGMDRGIDYTPLIEYLSECSVEHILCMYATGDRIIKQVKESSVRGKERFIQVKDLKEAVSLAKQCTRKNTACVLSPAAASYGYFKNFEERGEQFQKELGL